MKSRAFRVLVVIAFLSSFFIFIGGILGPHYIEEKIVVMVLSVVPIAIISALQYIFYGQYSPFYIFKTKIED